ncbi:hypothetical protein [Candidatus Rhabdochlamydia porcellionis]|jgi:hypothetical protein|uniref:Secreted protein n=1 Tax=Candidatus Rhabdochlamydia porcellionis TaxID=225148 RepID=A0ABX8Z183_9BACT|nr:hypothetical protein [Candidatus Rhabdochlamydia porcellionis]QZA59440.1 hypothetical protein RHAB15C_0001328 [Candidatus Rhabdochlamydia porcellionis]
MKKFLKIAYAYLALAFSFLFANTQEIQDLEVTQSIESISELENSFSGYKQKDYRGLKLSIPYVKLFYIGMGLDIDYHMNKEEAMTAFFFRRSAEIQRRPFVELCPKFALGKQYISSFLEMQVGFLKIPILFKEENAIVFVLRYGIGF